MCRHNSFTNSNHSAKTLHIEKNDSLSKNITTWEIQNTLEKQNTLRKKIHFRFSKHFEKTLHIEKIKSLCKNKTHWEKVFIYWKLVIDFIYSSVVIFSTILSNFWILKIIFYFYSDFFPSELFSEKRNQHILLSAIKSTEISTEGRYPPIPDIHTSAGIIVYSFRRINFTTFSEIFITLNSLSLSFLFMCRQTLWQTQITLEKHYTLRNQITMQSPYTLRNLLFPFSLVIIFFIYV